jgi:hypothetical protein
MNTDLSTILLDRIAQRDIKITWVRDATGGRLGLAQPACYITIMMALFP